jgi:hypothetical protein
MISLRTEWRAELETGYPPRSRKLGIPATTTKGGSVGADPPADWTGTLILGLGIRYFILVYLELIDDGWGKFL